MKILSLFTLMSFQTHENFVLQNKNNDFSSDTEEKKLLNKVVIFVFFTRTKYSRSFITLRLNHWCHMDYFNNDLTTFLGLERSSSVAVYAGSESSRIS